MLCLKSKFALILILFTETMILSKSLRKGHHHHPAPPVPVYVGHNLPDSITRRSLLQHFEEHNIWPDRVASTIINTPGKRHGKLFFDDSASAECAVAVLNGSKVGSFTIVVEHWESKVKQPPLRSQSRSGPLAVVTAKLSNCHYSYSSERLESMVHEIDPTANVVFHQTEGTKPNWAHINCAGLSSAEKVVARLHGTVIHDLPLSVKLVGSAQPSAAASIAQPVPLLPPQHAAVRPVSATASSVSVKVTYIPKLVTEDDILKLLSRNLEVSVKVREVEDQKFNYAYVNCPNQRVAAEVVQCLNGKSLRKAQLRAKIVEQSTATNAMPMEHSKQQKSFNAPREWEGNVEMFSLKDVPPGSTEFNRVLLLMQKTMPTVKIMKLERVQNKWLWNKYSQHCDEIKEKNGGVLVEKELFHGTGGNDPQLIYKGEEGFDMRFCSKGMWGRGCYFAASARYSHSYAYSVGTGSLDSRQMFLARVNIGETHECPSDRTLIMPPPKPSSQSATSSSVQFSVVRYDSVTGITKDTRVYIVYDNRKAYPFYLVTYTCS